jgi:hypothetical protein
MIHTFKITVEAMRTIKKKDTRIIKFKRMPKDGDRLLFEDIEGNQKEMNVTGVAAEREGLKANYYLVDIEDVNNEPENTEA